MRGLYSTTVSKFDEADLIVVSKLDFSFDMVMMLQQAKYLVETDKNQITMKRIVKYEGKTAKYCDARQN